MGVISSSSCHMVFCENLLILLNPIRVFQNISYQLCEIVSFSKEREREIWGIRGREREIGGINSIKQIKSTRLKLYFYLNCNHYQIPIACHRIKVIPNIAQFMSLISNESYVAYTQMSQYYYKFYYYYHRNDSRPLVFFLLLFIM